MCDWASDDGCLGVGGELAVVAGGFSGILLITDCLAKRIGDTIYVKIMRGSSFQGPELLAQTILEEKTPIGGTPISPLSAVQLQRKKMFFESCCRSLDDEVCRWRTRATQRLLPSPRGQLGLSPCHQRHQAEARRISKVQLHWGFPAGVRTDILLRKPPELQL